MAEASRNEKKNARRQAREQVFGLLYETEFHEGETAEQILERAAEDREFDGNDPYLRGTYLGVMAHLEEIDALIGRFAKGWKTKRLSRVSRAGGTGTDLHRASAADPSLGARRRV